jgi:hypothetical protein
MEVIVRQRPLVLLLCMAYSLLPCNVLCNEDQDRAAELIESTPFRLKEGMEDYALKTFDVGKLIFHYH